MSVTSVAVQFTIIDQLSKGINRIRSRMAELARGNKQVQNSFDRMNRSAKYAAIAAIGTREIYRGLKPAVSAAGSLQEAMLRVKGNLAGSARDAKELHRMLRTVQSSSVAFSANAPLSAEDVVNIQNALLKAGVSLKDVAGKGGAAFAATVLTSLSGEAADMIGDSLANIGSQFNLKGAEYGDLADWLVRVDDASATKIPALIQGLRMSGSSAKALGISARDSITALGALATLGERAGSSYNNMLLAMVGVSRESRRYMKHYKVSFFEEGKFIGMNRATALLRERFGSIQDDQKRSFILAKIFGEEGGRAANAFIDAAKGFDEIEAGAVNSLSAAEKLDIWAEGFNASLAKLGGTSRTTLATFFQPMLAPLTAVVNRTNEWVTALGKAAAEKSSLAKAVSGMSLGALATGGLATLGFGAGALYYGRKTLKGVGGLKGIFSGMGSAAAGIATGKAVEAATGVQPVFVTNWPADFGSGAGTPGKKEDPGLFTRMADGVKKSWAWLAGLGAAGYTSVTAALTAPSLAALGSLGAGVTAAAGALTALAGAAGYGTGKLMDMGASAVITRATGGESTNLGELIYGLTHRQLDPRIERFADRTEILRETINSGGNSRPEVRNDINIDMRIDRNDRVYAETNDMRTQAKLNVKRGHL